MRIVLNALIVSAVCSLPAFAFSSAIAQPTASQRSAAIDPRMQNVRLALRKLNPRSANSVTGEPQPDWTGGLTGEVNLQGQTNQSGASAYQGTTQPDWTGGRGNEVALQPGRYEVVTVCTARVGCPAHRLSIVAIDRRLIRRDGQGRFIFDVPRARTVSINGSVAARAN